MQKISRESRFPTFIMNIIAAALAYYIAELNETLG